MLVAVETAQIEVVAHGHRRDTAVAQRLLREDAHLAGLRFLALGVVALSRDDDLARGRLALPAKHLDQQRLAVAGNSGNAEDFARTDGELIDRKARGTEIAVGAQVADRQ